MPCYATGPHQLLRTGIHEPDGRLRLWRGHDGVEDVRRPKGLDLRDLRRGTSWHIVAHRGTSWHRVENQVLQNPEEIISVFRKETYFGDF